MVTFMDNMEPTAMIKTMLEFNSKALILGRKVGTLLHKELKEGGRAKVEELQEELKAQATKYEEEKAACEEERKEWLLERKHLGTWKVRSWICRKS